MNVTKYIATFFVFFIIILIGYVFLKTGTDVTFVGILGILGASIIMIILLYLWDLLILRKHKNK